MSSENIYLILGCFGRRDDTFVSCISVENRILKVSNSLVGYNDLMDYLEAVRLFDKPLFDFNAVRNLIFKLQENYDQGLKRLWTEKNFHLYQKFILDHKMCGTYIKLSLVPLEYDQEQIKEEKIFIKAGESKIKLVR